ncbi:gamma-glutamyltransferase [Chitinophaga sp. MM2321]|uniref:gamma-glutamyltransferase n=1 Tax=Chitinophaga sp. MM2321 TaxID=3137178 RepID=UPI0032D57F12
MDRKDFLKWGSAGVFTTALGLNSRAAGFISDKPVPGMELASHWGTKEISGQKAMVCASQPLAVAAGYDVLKAGGNAIDAAIAVNAMLCLTEPMMCGLGGDLFAIVWSEKEKKLYGLNGSGRSPYNWSVSEARKLGLERIPSFGPLSWSVPGCVSGWNELLKKFGSKNLSDLLQPAIDYAKEGFPVTPAISGDWKPENGVTDYATLNGTFLFENKGMKAGEIFRNPALARTLEIIAAQGANAFYEGEIADSMVAFSKKHGGRFEKRDFTAHRSDWITPVHTNYRGYDVWQLPPNGQGMTVLQMLNILEKFDIAGCKANSAESFHLFLEAKKLCFQDRAIYYADTDFSTAAIKELLSKDYAAQRAALINPRKAQQTYQPGRIKNSSNTVYLTVADKEGNMVSLIQSLYSPWGSHYVVDGLGFALQNRGTLLSLNEAAWNKLEPHKRPFHTIIPAFVTKDSNPVFSFGVTGGDFQPQGQVQILMNMIDHKMSVQQAGDQLRLWHRESFEFTNEKAKDAGKIVAEPGFSDKVKQQLQRMGHQFSDQTRYFGGYQGIWKSADPRVYTGASDPRKDGCAFGY